MPILGQGILPSGAAGSELVAVTRRAFIPKVVVQIYKSTPTLSAFLAAAEGVTGGLSPITQPVQGAAMVTTQNTDYSGSFNSPQLQQGIQNAEFNLKAYVTPIPFYVMEGLAQMDAAVIPLVEARMNDAGNSISDTLSTDLWVPNASALALWSIPDVIKTTDPTRGAFGNIARASNAFWQGKVIDAQETAANVAPTRARVLRDIVAATKAASGEMPNFGVASPGVWAQLAQDFVGQERYVHTPEGAYGSDDKSVNAAFTALSVAGVPIYIDPYKPEPAGAGADKGIAYLNTNYIGFKIHSDAAFAVAGPESLLANNQLGYIMVLVLLAELVCSKPAAQAHSLGYTALAV